MKGKERSLQNLIPTTFRTSQERAEIARKGGRARGEQRRRVRDYKEVFGVEPMTKDKVKEIDALLLAMNNEDLKKVAGDNSLPTYMRRRARMLMNGDDYAAVDMSEKMMDRAFGKPKQELDADLSGSGPIILMDNHIG